MENQTSKFDNVLWMLVVLIFVAGIGGNYYFASQSLLLRAVVLLLLAGAAMFFAAKTALVQKAWAYWLEALIEVRKVVWPTKKETIQATSGVLAMVFVLGLLLWSIDSILIRVVAWILGH